MNWLGNLLCRIWMLCLMTVRNIHNVGASVVTLRMMPSSLAWPPNPAFLLSILLSAVSQLMLLQPASSLFHGLSRLFPPQGFILSPTPLV